MTDAWSFSYWQKQKGPKLKPMCHGTHARIYFGPITALRIREIICACGLSISLLLLLLHVLLLALCHIGPTVSIKHLSMTVGRSCEYSRYDVIMECRTPALQCGLEHQKIFTKTSEFWEQFYFCFFISFVSFKPQTSQTNLFWIFFFFVKLSSNIFELLSYLFFFKILLSITIF